MCCDELQSSSFAQVLTDVLRGSDHKTPSILGENESPAIKSDIRRRVYNASAVDLRLCASSDLAGES
jgi:hypothetical protein